jgi:hypothetical protein
MRISLTSFAIWCTHCVELHVLNHARLIHLNFYEDRNTNSTNTHSGRLRIIHFYPQGLAFAANEGEEELLGTQVGVYVLVGRHVAQLKDVYSSVCHT